MTGGNMKIQDFGSIQMNRTDSRHFGNGRIVPLTKKLAGNTPVSSVNGINSQTQASQINRADGVSSRSFSDYLMEAVQAVNSQQLQVSDLEQKFITNPDDVDVHDVTVAISKARSSFNLAQTVIDRLVSGWNEITTTR